MHLRSVIIGSLLGASFLSSGLKAEELSSPVFIDDVHCTGIGVLRTEDVIKDSCRI